MYHHSTVPISLVGYLKVKIAREGKEKENNGILRALRLSRRNG